MLQHDHVTLALLVLHLGFQSGAKGVKEVSAGGRLLGGGEEADPAETGDDTLFFRGGGELDEGGDSGEDITEEEMGVRPDD